MTVRVVTIVYFLRSSAYRCRNEACLTIVKSSDLTIVYTSKHRREARKCPSSQCLFMGTLEGRKIQQMCSFNHVDLADSFQQLVTPIPLSGLTILFRLLEA